VSGQCRTHGDGQCNVTQHPHEHAGMLSLDGGTKVLDGSTAALCTDSDV
jgi:hypothetical protein